MSSEQVFCRFADLFETPQRNGLTRPKRVRGAGLPMVNMGELFAHKRIHDIPMDLVPFKDSEGASLLKHGDLLFARQSLVLAGAGQCSIFLGHKKTVFESHLIRCRIDPNKGDPLFYYYFFSSQPGKDLIRQIVSQGAGASGIKGSELVELKVPCLSIALQKKISQLMNAIDEEIETLEHQNTALEAIAQHLFCSWFINFDPVHTKAGGREPEAMSAEMAALFPNEFGESELGAIPKGWNVGSLKDVSLLNPEAWSSRNHPAQLEYIDLSGVKKNVFTEPGRYRYEDAPSRARRVLRKGDSLYGTVRPGNLSYGYIGANHAGLTGSTGFAVLRPKKAVHAEFIYCAMTNKENIKRLVSLAEGAAYPAVRPEIVHEQKVAIPDQNVMSAFHDATRQLFEQHALNQALTNCLSGLRDHLLPRLISGKLSMEAAECAVSMHVTA